MVSAGACSGRSGHQGKAMRGDRNPEEDEGLGLQPRAHAVTGLEERPLAA
jgi:hypothetical protein